MTSVVRYPQLYAVVGANSNQSQNYFVDLEVTPFKSGGLLMACYP